MKAFWLGVFLTLCGVLGWHLGDRYLWTHAPATGWAIRYPNGDIASSLDRPDFDASQFVCVHRPYVNVDSLPHRNLVTSCHRNDGTVIDEWIVGDSTP